MYRKAVFAASLVASAVSWLGCSATESPSSTGGAGGANSSTGSASSGTGSTSSSTGGTSGGTGGAGADTGGTSSGTGGTLGTGGTVDNCTPGSGTEDVGTASLRDKATCLVWQKTNTYVGGVVNHDGAKHCDDLVQDGFDDWRLPTAQEMRTYPGLPASANAYLAGPIYIPSGSTETEGCTGSSHSCNLTQYSAGNFGCAWQGPGANSYGLFCVRGAAQSTLDPAFLVGTCCPSSSTYKVADCSAY